MKTEGQDRTRNAPRRAILDSSFLHRNGKKVTQCHEPGRFSMNGEASRLGIPDPFRGAKFAGIRQVLVY